MSFRDQLKSNYQKKETYSFSQTRVNQAADKILKSVKSSMMAQAKSGNVSRVGLLNRKGVEDKVSAFICSKTGSGDYRRELINTPCQLSYDGEVGGPYYCHDMRECNALVNRLKVLCASEGISVSKSGEFDSRTILFWTYF